MTKRVEEPTAAADCASRPHACRRGRKGSAAASTQRARQSASLVLEVLAGQRSPADAAQVLGVSVVRYYAIESRAVTGLVSACEPQPRGRGPASGNERELGRLRQVQRSLQQEVARLQALCRSQRQVLGTPAPAKPAAAAAGKPGKRRHRPRVRAATFSQRLAASQEPDRPPAGSEVARATGEAVETCTTAPGQSVSADKDTCIR
jgi:hypothetical protein